MGRVRFNGGTSQPPPTGLRLIEKRFEFFDRKTRITNDCSQCANVNFRMRWHGQRRKWISPYHRDVASSLPVNFESCLSQRF